MWDGENRMVESVIGGVTTAYVYDGEGRRVKKVKTTTAPATTTVTRFVYNASGALAAEYGPVEAEGDTEYFMADHLGSTRLVTSRAGAAKRAFDYLPFGEEIPQGVSGRGALYPLDGATPTSGKKFTGHYRDSETGLDYFGARYLSAAQGRFSSPDPSPDGVSIADPQSWNLYSYVRNRPTRFVDVGGRWPTEVHAQIVTSALHGYASAGELATLAKQQYVIDADQSLGVQYRHAMSVGEPGSATLSKMWQEVAMEVTPGSPLRALGDAIHTLQDWTSPAHTTDSGMPRVWKGGYWPPAKWGPGLAHLMNEDAPPFGSYTNDRAASYWSRIGLAVRLTMAAFMQWNPDRARAGGLTAATFDAEAAKRISGLVQRYYSLITASYTRSRMLEEDAARQCALGNPAACHD